MLAFVCVCVCVCVCVVGVIVKRPVLPPSVVDGRSRNPLYYYYYYNYEFILYYASAIHKHTYAHILKPFEHSEPTGLQVDIALIPVYTLGEETLLLILQSAV